MDTNASSGRFYAFTSNNSGTLPSSASPPDPQYRRDSSGSSSVSDDDGSASQHSHPPGRAQPAYGGPRAPYTTQNPPSFPQHRAESAPATVFVDDPPFNPQTHSQHSQQPHYVQTAPDVLYTHPVAHSHPVFQSSVASTTQYGPPFRRNSNGSSPTGSNGSGVSDHRGGHSGSSHGSASSGVVSTGSPPRDPPLHGHDVFPLRQGGIPPPGFNPVHYPAYDEQFRRVGMEHGRFGTDPVAAYNAYYRPRTHTYATVGGQSMTMGGPPGPMHMPPLTHPSDMMQPRHAMYPDDNSPFVPGQTRIHLPPPPAPPQQDFENYVYDQSEPHIINVGDDAYIPAATDDDIRRILGLSPDMELSLNALADPPPGERPGQSIPTLSQLAILGSPERRLTLQEIYRALEDRFEWFRDNSNDKSWQNSIRHNLSLYKCFRREPKPITEPGKGAYWTVDYSEGPGLKRPRKRRSPRSKARRRLEEAEREAEAEAQKALEAQEGVDEGDSSQEGMDEDESHSSPLSTPGIPIDPVLQQMGRQVGQPRNTRSAARSAARRGNSPYAQGNQPLPTRRDTAPSSLPNLAPLGSRQASATFGQPSFGQPAFGVTGMGIFGQPSFGGRPSEGFQSHEGLFLPPPQPRPTTSASGFPPSEGSQMRHQPTRSNTVPNNMGATHFPQLPSLPGFNQLRDAAGRFVPRGNPTPGGSQMFVQGSSRQGHPQGGRDTSSSSSSSPSRM